MKTGNCVVICTVAGGPPNWPYVNSIFGLQTPGHKIFHCVHGKLGVDEGHNRLIRWFLSETDYEWMLHLDSDAVVHPNTLLRLLSWEKKFVCALAFQRKPPFSPVVYSGQVGKTNQFRRPIVEVLKWIGDHPGLMTMGSPVVLDPRPPDALYEVDRGGAHCLLTHRSVLLDIPDPWYERDPIQGTGAGSDFDFYSKARKAGHTTWLDRSVLAGHCISDHIIGAMDFTVWSRACIWTEGGAPAGLQVEIPKVKLLDVTENTQED